MKIVKITTLLVLGSAGSLLVSCGQKQQSVPEPPAKVEQAPEAPAAATAKPADMPAPAVAISTPATDQAQGLIDKVKGLIVEKKYTEALAALQDLSALKLTAEQQAMANELKAQIQKAMSAQATSEATKAAGGLLGK